VFPVRYELGFYIPGEDILHSHLRENLKSYIHSMKSQQTTVPKQLILTTRQCDNCVRVAGSWAANGLWQFPSSLTCLTSGHSSTPHSTP
jgi:hypothetical protein